MITAKAYFRALAFFGLAVGTVNLNVVARPSDELNHGAVLFENGLLKASLSNKKKIPLVGLGVGHSPRHHVAALVAEAVQEGSRVRLIDTTTSNEAAVAEGILAGAERLGRDEKMEVHLVSKIWYTQLGYERTKKSVENTLALLGPVIDSNKVDLKIHLMLNWPRCYEYVSHAGCAVEEASLDPLIKQAGPDPSKDRDSWVASWKFFEEIYLSGKYPIESIGLSNFHMEDIEKMDGFARISPHILQVSMWSIIYDSIMIDYCTQHSIHLQVYNALQGTVAKPGRAPHAYRHIQKISNDLSRQTSLPVTPAQAVLAWLVQHGISVIPRTSKLARLEENSAVVLASIPTLDESQVETIAHSVEAFMSGEDFEKDLYASVTFHAVVDDLMLYWMLEDGREMRIDHIWKGQTFNETTYPNHVYRAYNAHNKDVYSEYTVDVNFGEHKHIYVDKFDYDDSMPNTASIPHRISVATDRK